MDGEEDYEHRRGVDDSLQYSNYASGLSLSMEASDWENEFNTEKHGNIGDMTFCMTSYIKEAMKMMYMMRSHQMLTDVILQVGTELFHAHKVILAAASPYFKVILTDYSYHLLKSLTYSHSTPQAMFTGGLKESEMTRIKLQGICPTAMTKLIFFMYTGQIRVTEITVCSLLIAATMFQVLLQLIHFYVTFNLSINMKSIINPNYRN